MAEHRSIKQRLWALCCSLKVAIVLASLATFLAMPGSVLIHFNPAVFSALDQMTLADWWRTYGTANGNLTWWLALFAALVILLGINTACCFIDWITKLGARWKKTGEYLIHLGFVLILLAYIWGNLSGFRLDNTPIFEGEILAIRQWPGYSLRLDSFEPILNDQGRPLDMLNRVSLLRGEELLQQTTARINHPLTWQGLVVVPVSFGRQAQGFTFFFPGKGNINLLRGTSIELDAGARLTIEEFFPDARQSAGSKVRQRGSQVGNPAMRLLLQRPGHDDWQGWYFLRNPLPYELVSAGIRFWPTQPVYRTYSQLTINHDPGARLALMGGGSILAGVCIALASFYRKRRLGDRPFVE